MMFSESKSFPEGELYEARPTSTPMRSDIASSKQKTFCDHNTRRIFYMRS